MRKHGHGGEPSLGGWRGEPGRAWWQEALPVQGLELVSAPPFCASRGRYLGMVGTLSEGGLVDLRFGMFVFPLWGLKCTLDDLKACLCQVTKVASMEPAVVMSSPGLHCPRCAAGRAAVLSGYPTNGHDEL